MDVPPKTFIGLLVTLKTAVLLMAWAPSPAGGQEDEIASTTFGVLVVPAIINHWILPH